MSLFNSSFSLFQNTVMYFSPFSIIYTSIVIVLVCVSRLRRDFTSLLCNGTTWLCLWWLKHKNTLETTRWLYLFSRNHDSVIVDVTQSLLGTILWRNYSIFLMYHHAELLTDRNINTVIAISVIALSGLKYLHEALSKVLEYFWWYPKKHRQNLI